MAYDNRTRERRAQETRRRVLAAASDAFVAHGFAATTIRGVATAAGVSPETVYKRFGSKAGLLKAVYDITLAGDDEPVTIAERPEFVAVATAPDAGSAVRAYAALCGWLSTRTGPLLRVALTSRSGDADLEEFAATIAQERLAGARMTIGAWHDRGWLRPGLGRERAVDLLWTFNSPAVYLMLDERGWTREAYEEWLVEVMLASLVRA